MKYWIFTASNHNKYNKNLIGSNVFAQRMKDKFWALADTTNNAHNLSAGDKVIFYIDKPEMKFVGTATLKSDYFQLNDTQRKTYEHKHPYFDCEYGVVLGDIHIWDKALPVKELIDDLDFIQKKQRWFTYFQGSITKIIEDSDYKQIIVSQLSNLINKDNHDDEKEYINNSKHPVHFFDNYLLNKIFPFILKSIDIENITWKIVQKGIQFSLDQRFMVIDSHSNKKVLLGFFDEKNIIELTYSFSKNIDSDRDPKWLYITKNYSNFDNETETIILCSYNLLLGNDINKIKFNNKQVQKTPPPIYTRNNNSSSKSFKGRKNVDYDAIRRENDKLGKKGEEMILNYEITYLKSNGKFELADKVEHSSEIHGDGIGYDIKSFSLDGKEKYIEVKTTTKGITTPFFMSINEKHFMEENQNNYRLVRVNNFDKSTNKGDFFELTSNELLTEYTFEATEFKVYRLK
ncbi:MAG: protein NO VEIN domain-containing protein [bacterium]